MAYVVGANTNGQTCLNVNIGSTSVPTAIPGTYSEASLGLVRTLLLKGPGPSFTAAPNPPPLPPSPAPFSGAPVNLWAAGSGNYVGLVTAGDRLIPVAVTTGFPAGAEIRPSITTQFNTHFAVDTFGQAYGVGDGGIGKIGANTPAVVVTTFIPLRYRVTNVSAVTASNGNSGLLDANGGLWLWGSDYSYNGLSGRAESIPFPVMSSKRFVQVSAANFGGAALTTDGELWVWGTPQAPRFCSSISANIQTPIYINLTSTFGLDAIVDISLGYYHMLLRTQSGKVFGMLFAKS